MDTSSPAIPYFNDFFKDHFEKTYLVIDLKEILLLKSSAILKLLASLELLIV